MGEDKRETGGVGDVTDKMEDVLSNRVKMSLRGVFKDELASPYPSGSLSPVLKHTRHSHTQMRAHTRSWPAMRTL